MLFLTRRYKVFPAGFFKNNNMMHPGSLGRNPGVVTVNVQCVVAKKSAASVIEESGPRLPNESRR